MAQPQQQKLNLDLQRLLTAELLKIGDPIPMPRWMIESTHEGLRLANKKITVLEQLTRDLATCLRELLEHAPYTDHTVRAIVTLQKLEALPK